MARRKIREYETKRLLAEHLNKETNYSGKSAQVGPDTKLDNLLKTHSWLKDTKLVVKPDMLFGKRGKNNLVLLDASWDDAKKFIKEKMNKEVEVGAVKGPITHFIVEPFVSHKDEYYLSIIATREGETINFSTTGGMDVEANWDKMLHLDVSTDQELDNKKLQDKLGLEGDKKAKTANFILACHKLFRELDFTLLEFNPFTYDAKGNPFPLDARGELDDTAEFKDRKKWGAIEFPRPFGRKLYPEEQYIKDLDSKSGSSLKLTLLNPKAHIWTMVAGGGASVIYTDTIADLGMGKELANYGEYSGNPNTEETYLYAKTILELATSHPDGKPKALIIGGGIANFTDVANTFKGIIKALKEYKEKLKKAKVRVYVRRGGPNYQTGLELMRNLGKELGVPIEVYGPEASMTTIVPMAIKYVKGGA